MKPTFAAILYTVAILNFLNLNLMVQKYKIYVLNVKYIKNNEIIAFSIFWWLFWQPV